MTLTGGLLGVGLAMASTSIVHSTLGWTLVTSRETNILAVAFAILVGIAFGCYPAWRASRLDPVEAMRRE